MGDPAHMREISLSSQQFCRTKCQQCNISEVYDLGISEVYDLGNPVSAGDAVFAALQATDSQQQKVQVCKKHIHGPV